MASPQDIANFRNLQVGPPPGAIPPPPPIPDDVKQRFPSMKGYEDRVKEWAQKTLNISTQGPQ